MIPVAAIVEGHGEVKALPVLLRRMGPWLSPQCQFSALHPIRVHRDRFLNNEGEFRHTLRLAANKSGDNGWILVLLDADDDCPAKLGPQTLERAKAIVPHRRLSVVLANREFEAWFLAAAYSLDGKRGFSCSEEPVFDPDTLRNAKGWIGEHMSSDRKYREITDQPAFAAMFDLEAAHTRSRSFRKLCDEFVKCGSSQKTFQGHNGTDSRTI
uniref:DUF4276 family protein n=1 Tax=Candidatus Kentrum eta TaxID=2126337 RepID=A0A450V934_9GAMM|nr:MAG: protein of unknown function (DUF4276) [Candidatus Kentron sp. H]VFJ94053.1 MAG: protein of unknown function (DUF4276) [Candidatus Kentron sp. H]VFK01256.1 MAG: protein of unknown function (DUF4276) [Candidatus Kentron sp. H]